MRLTTKRVLRALKIAGRYPDGDNLYLQVSKPGKGSWLLRYTRDGRERMLGLGPLHTVTLAEARVRAKAARQLLLDGVDPVDQKRAQKAQRALAAAKLMTFEEAARTYHTGHEGKWRNRQHAHQWINSLERYVFPIIGDLPVAEIDTGLVLKCIEPHWQSTTETMSRVRGRIESVLGWAAVRGYRTGDNPAQWRNHLDKVLPARNKIARPNHHLALPYSQIAQFLADLRPREGAAVRALEFAIYTAARTGEVVGARWSEIDFTEKLWIIPAGRMKGGQQHRVPLSDRALEILAEVAREDGNEFVFIGPRVGAGLSGTALFNVLRRMGGTDITVHGFRSTFRDWASEKSNFPNHVVEMALAHAIADKTEAAYRRGDLLPKRRALMQAWAQYCARLPANGGNVIVPLRAVK
jgi:integrase